MPISRDKKNGKYYVKVWSNKVLYTPAKVGMSKTSWETKVEAQAAEVELRRLIGAQSSTIPTTLDLLSCCNLYLKDQASRVIGHDTLDKKKRFCKEILKTWGNIPIADLRVFMVQKYLSDRAEQFTSNSFNTYRKEGVAMLNWAIDQQLLPPDTVNVFAKVKKLAHSTGGPKPAPLDDVMMVISIANQEQKDLIMAYLLTGARKSEILTMTWGDIDLKAKTYKLHTRKTGNQLIKTTLHEMHELLFEIISRKYENRKPGIDYVFWHRYYSHSRKEYVEDRYMSLNKFTKRLCEKAGVPLFTMHQFRHLAATLLKENGASLSELQLFLRHDAQKTTEIYAGHLDNSTAKQSEYLGNFWSGKLAEAAGSR